MLVAIEIFAARLKACPDTNLTCARKSAEGAFS
jgi:hypothetical protein